MIKMSIGNVKFKHVLKHTFYLEEISRYLDDKYNPIESLFLRLYSFPIKIYQLKEKDKIQVKRGIKNAWYHECSLIESNNQEYKFFAWNINKFYYSVYCALSAIVRIINPNIKRETHYTKIKIYNNNAKLNNNFSNFFICPFNIIFDKEKNKILNLKKEEKYQYPKIINALKWTADKTEFKTIGLFDYFKNLREWATYSQPKLFSYAYGNKIRKILSHNLINISILFNVLAEAFIIRQIGFEDIEKEFNDFLEPTENNLNFNCKFLKKRFSLHEKYSK